LNNFVYFVSLLSITGAMYRIFFFFQAEDGIRDGHVTGVQTCALPIWWRVRLSDQSDAPPELAFGVKPGLRRRGIGAALLTQFVKIGERRVGKECRSRWSPDE